MNAVNFSIMLLAFYSFSGCTGSVSEGNTSASKAHLLISIEEFNTAFSEANAALLESMITENYLHTNGNAKATHKTDWISYLQVRKREIASGTLLVNSYEMDQVEIEFYHKTAIVTGRVSTSVTRQGATIENEYRVTHLWVIENGNWKRAGFHDGKIR